MNYNYHNMFTPSGNLNQVQFATNATKLSDDSVMAICGKDSVCVISRQVKSKLMESKPVIFKINENISCCMIGRISDGNKLINYAQKEAVEYEFNFGTKISIFTLTQKMAGLVYNFTNNYNLRPFGVSLILFGINTLDSKPEVNIYKVEPSGDFVKYKAICAGVREDEINQFLENKINDKTFEELSQNDLMIVSINKFRDFFCDSFDLDNIQMVTASFEKQNPEIISKDVMKNLFHN